eukprot:Gb_03923 [translate_table: standard]
MSLSSQGSDIKAKHESNGLVEPDKDHPTSASMHDGSMGEARSERDKLSTGDVIENRNIMLSSESKGMKPENGGNQLLQGKSKPEDVYVWNDLSDKHTKCESLEVACQLFGKMPERKIVPGSATIAPYVKNGNVIEALIPFYGCCSFFI